MSPDYRFWGRTPPPAARPPLRAEAPSGKDAGDGVVTLRLYAPIDSWGGIWGVSAAEFAATLDDITAERIELHVNSPGGEVFEGIAILNALRQHPARVSAVVDGLAASAASFIAVGADELTMGHNSELMIHDAWGLCVGNAADMRDLAGRLDQLSDNIADIYARKAGGSTREWRDAMVAESWYSAEESVTAGLADRVADDGDAEPSNRFDLSGFAHAGRSDAPPPPDPAHQAADTDRLRSLADARHRLIAARYRLSV